MRISTMACHALHLLLCLSEQEDDIPASASELSVSTGISEKFVQKIMRLLQGEGIVKSVRGIAGAMERVTPVRARRRLSARR